MHMATLVPDQGGWFQSEVCPKMFVEEMKRKQGRRAGNLEQETYEALTEGNRSLKSQSFEHQEKGCKLF